MKQRIFYVFLFLFVVGCAATAPKLAETVRFDEVKELEKRMEIAPVEEPTPPPTQEAKAGEKVVKKKKVVKKRRKKRRSRSKRLGSLPLSTKVRQPTYEDSVGFKGRRPIKDPFRVGEKITFMLTYFGVSAGDGTMEVKPFKEVNGRKAYHFYSKLDSSAVFSMFYKVDDFCEGYLDYEELVPYTYSISAIESAQRKEMRLFFDWKTRTADFWQKRVTDKGVDEKKFSWKIDPFSQNVYTAAQYIRFFDLQVGKTYVYAVSDDKKNWKVKAKVLRKEKLKTAVGTFDTFVIHPEVHVEGMLKPMGKVLFWYTADDRKFPVKVEAKIKIGKVIGYLKGLEKGG